MKIEELKILAAVFQEPNLTKISKRFALSQSNLSKIIKKVEEELGFDLFERKGFQGLRPTAQGIVFSERVERFSKSWEDSLSLIKSYDQRRMDIKVTGPSIYMRNIFLPAWFESSLPKNYRLSYVRSRLDQISLTAQSGDLDLAITPSPFELSDWVPIPIFTEKFALFYSAPKALKSINELNLEKMDWIAYRASNPILPSFMQQQQIPADRIVAYIDDIESILDLIENQKGLLAILPAHATKTHPNLHSFQIKSSAARSLYLMYRPGQAILKNCVKDLKAILKNTGESP
jgi:DNA-binding transcriptional LysR family regulator